MKSAAIAVASLTVLAAIGQAQTPAPTFLVIVDDLNLEFRTTPQLRDLTGRVFRTLVTNTARGSVVSTSHPETLVPPTSDAAALEAANRRLVGSGLKLREVLAAQQQPELGLELRHRAASALESATGAINRVSGLQSGAPLAVIYISNGDAAGDLAERTALIQAALRARAAVHAIDPRGFLSPESNQGVDQADWDAYLKTTRASLMALADQTQGTMSVTADELVSLLSRLVKTGL